MLAEVHFKVRLVMFNTSVFINQQPLQCIANVSDVTVRGNGSMKDFLLVFNGVSALLHVYESSDHIYKHLQRNASYDHNL